MLAIDAKKRIVAEEKPSATRKQNFIPAVLYGYKVENMPISIDGKIFSHLYKEAGENTIVELNIEGKKYNVLIKDVQLEPVKDTFLHVDFYQVNMEKKITAFIPLIFEGESPLVKSGEAIMIKAMDEIEVECLPMDLLHEIKIDISVLESFEHSIHISDLQVSDKVKILAEPEESIISLSEPRAEVEETPGAEEGAELAEGEEKPAEGEEAPAKGEADNNSK